jgi:LacI family transcriptional regulator
MAVRRITRNDVARRAGVSVAVVSYVVNNGPRPVSAETRAKVEKAIEELGYYPNELARSLRTQQTLTLGLIVPNLANPVFSEIAASVQRICLENGYLLLLGDSGRDPLLDRSLSLMFRAKQVDGIIIHTYHSPRRLARLIQAAGIPIVLLQQDLPGVHCVVLTELEGGLMGTQHLLELGHRRIAFISEPSSDVVSMGRVQGYAQAMAAAGLPADAETLVEVESSHTGGYQGMQRLLALPERPTAVFAFNDLIALGALHAIRQAGLSVPGDVSVVGYDNIDAAAYTSPPLTSVHFSKAEMGEQAARTVLELARKTETPGPSTVRLPVNLVVRESTDSPPNSWRGASEC